MFALCVSSMAFCMCCSQLCMSPTCVVGLAVRSRASSSAMANFSRAVCSVHLPNVSRVGDYKKVAETFNQFSNFMAFETRLRVSIPRNAGEELKMNQNKTRSNVLSWQSFRKHIFVFLSALSSFVKANVRLIVRLRVNIFPYFSSCDFATWRSIFPTRVRPELISHMTRMPNWVQLIFEIFLASYAAHIFTFPFCFSLKLNFWNLHTVDCKCELNNS